MKVVCISDTHNQHDKVELPEGDVLVHSGDFSGTGTLKQVISFTKWFASQPHPHKILVAGNHDITLDISFYDSNWHRFHNKCLSASDIKNFVLRSGVHYLENSGVEIEDVKFYGSPCQPTFCNWAFNVDRGLPIRSVWSKIPEDTDVLITHGPPRGVGDVLQTGESVGCDDLWDAVKRVRPQYHIFGHIHEGYGLHTREGISFVNPSICDHNYKVVNSPLVFEVSNE